MNVAIRVKESFISDYYKIFNRGENTFISLYGVLPESVPSSFDNEIKHIIHNPVDVIVNCFFLEKMNTNWLSYLSTLQNILKDIGGELIFIHISEELKKSISENMKIRHEYGSFIEATHDKLERSDSPNNFISSFIHSTQKTMFIQAHTPVLRKQFKLNTEHSFPQEINGYTIVEFSNFVLVITLSLDKKLYLEIVSNMLGEEVIEINDENKDAVAELMNIILGNTRGLLGDDHGLNVSIPVANLGLRWPLIHYTFQDKELNLLSGGEVYSLPFASKNGDFEINFWVSENDRVHLFNLIKKI
ncbi:MAG: chemotaxis protein CheX [Halobacteriovoraceae bacterium]|nr:chemotaxis protein CheX [Halobacteriovoraceae bacterium]